MRNTKEIVFIVDDEPMHAQMMEDHLKTDFPLFEIYTYKTGEQCNDNMDKKPGIVILDYHLDAVDKRARNGIEILTHLRKNYPDTQVIMISGQDKIEIAVECMREGAYDYIVKNATSFIHVENTIERLFKHRSVLKNLEKYRTLNRVLIWGLILIVAISVALFYSGIIN